MTHPNPVTYTVRLSPSEAVELLRPDGTTHEYSGGLHLDLAVDVTDAGDLLTLAEDLEGLAADMREEHAAAVSDGVEA